MVRAAQVAESSGYRGVWSTDHFSGNVVGAPWSRHPFVVLGAIAQATSWITVGTLVANTANRHPVQLASAMSTLQSLAGPDRVLCGVGAGAGPDSDFAREATAIGREIPPAAERRVALAEGIGAFRSCWGGDGIEAVTHGGPPPPVIVGASSKATIDVALAHADGVNIRTRPNIDALVAHALDGARSETFEVGVFDHFDPGHPLGGEVDAYEAAGVARRTLLVRVPYPLAAIIAVGEALAGRP